MWCCSWDCTLIYMHRHTHNWFSFSSFTNSQPLSNYTFWNVFVITFSSTNCGQTSVRIFSLDALMSLRRGEWSRDNILKESIVTHPFKPVTWVVPPNTTTASRADSTPKLKDERMKMSACHPGDLGFESCVDSDELYLLALADTILWKSRKLFSTNA